METSIFVGNDPRLWQWALRPRHPRHLADPGRSISGEIERGNEAGRPEIFAWKWTWKLMIEALEIGIWCDFMEYNWIYITKIHQNSPNMDSIWVCHLKMGEAPVLAIQWGKSWWAFGGCHVLKQTQWGTVPTTTPMYPFNCQQTTVVLGFESESHLHGILWHTYGGVLSHRLTPSHHPFKWDVLL